MPWVQVLHLFTHSVCATGGYIVFIELFLGLNRTIHWACFGVLFYVQHATHNGWPVSVGTLQICLWVGVTLQLLDWLTVSLLESSRSSESSLLSGMEWPGAAEVHHPTLDLWPSHTNHHLCYNKLCIIMGIGNQLQSVVYMYTSSVHWLAVSNMAISFIRKHNGVIYTCMGQSV